MTERERGELAAIDALLSLRGDEEVAGRLSRALRPSAPPWLGTVGWIVTAAACLLAGLVGFEAGATIGGGVAPRPTPSTPMPLGLRPWGRR